MIGIAVSCGVCCAFGTPFGGILFAMEVTAAYYMVATLWKCFFCITFTLVIYKLFSFVNIVTMFTQTKYVPVILNHELIFFMMLGFICGGVAATSNLILSKIVFLRVKLKLPFITHRWKVFIMIKMYSGVLQLALLFQL